MHYYFIGVTEARNASFGLLTYCSEKPLELGQIVQVPYGRLETKGVVFKEVNKPRFETKAVLSILTNAGFVEPDEMTSDQTNSEQPSHPALPADLLQSLQWLQEYYVTSISSIVANALPKGIEKNRRKKDAAPNNQKPAKQHDLTPDQAKAVELITKATQPVILHGVTGSGKTRIYQEIAEQTLRQGRSVLVLTPEIGLAPQLKIAFEQHFGTVVITHSGLTESERHSSWLAAAKAEPKVIIGTRSALFAPDPNIGAIIVDEFHDQAYKQSSTPKYDAINLAAVRAKHCNAKLVLGSATPDAGRYYRSQQLGRPVVNLTKTAKQIAKPNIQLVDMTDSSSRHAKNWLSNQLFRLIEQTLQSKQQILLFHNRRGSAPLMLCTDCGWSADCKRCHIPMTLHADLHRTRCHVCNLQEQVPVNCPDCKNPDIVARGFGTKQIASDLGKLFPAANIARFDTDNTKSDSLQARFDDIKSGNIDILVGTQMLTKGLDLPKLTAVGIVLAEAGLSLPDYSSNERTFQQIHQVFGRVGRHSNENKIIVQTYNANSDFIKSIQKDDWRGFYNTEIANRQRYNFPPFTNILLLKNDYASRQAASNSATKFAAELSKIPNIEVLGPTPAFHERTRGRFHWQIVVKAANRSKLQTIVKEKLPTSGKWQFELDPFSLL